MGDTEPHVEPALSPKAREAGAGHLSGDAPDDLAHEVTVGVRVIGVAGADGPPCRSCRKRSGHGFPLPEVIVSEQCADRRYGRLVRQRMANGDGLLAALGELGPELANSCVEREHPLVDELQHERRAERLADRIEVHQGVGLPRDGARLVLPATNEVNDHLASDDDGDRSAHLTVLGKVRGKRVTHCCETRLAVSGNRCVHRPHRRTANALHDIL